MIDIIKNIFDFLIDKYNYKVIEEKVNGMYAIITYTNSSCIIDLYYEFYSCYFEFNIKVNGKNIEIESFKNKINSIDKKYLEQNNEYFNEYFKKYQNVSNIINKASTLNLILFQFKHL